MEFFAYATTTVIIAIGLACVTEWLFNRLDPWADALSAPRKPQMVKSKMNLRALRGNRARAKVPNHSHSRNRFQIEVRELPFVC